MSYVSAAPAPVRSNDFSNHWDLHADYPTDSDGVCDVHKHLMTSLEVFALQYSMSFASLLSGGCAWYSTFGTLPRRPVVRLMNRECCTLIALCRMGILENKGSSLVNECHGDVGA